MYIFNYKTYAEASCVWERQKPFSSLHLSVWSERSEDKMSVLQEISSNVKNMKQLEYSALAKRANKIKEELRQV